MGWTVYQHKNKINNKSYIGITSRIPSERWGKNGKNYARYPKFYPAILKYGWNNFEHIILETNLSKEEACLKEQYYIKFFNSYSNGYNASLGGESGSNGCKKQQKSRKKISIGLKKYLQANPKELEKRKINLLKEENWKKRQKKVEEYFKKGSENAKKRVEKNKKWVYCLEEPNHIFTSINSAAEWCNINPSGISKCLKGIQKSARKHPKNKKSLHWKYWT